MTVYVDPIFNAVPRNAQTASYGIRWCHMWTDADPEELHQMAQRIGLHRSGYQDHPGGQHYDLVASKRALALRYGAIEAESIGNYVRRKQAKR